MSGICGIVSLDGGPVLRTEIDAMIEPLKRRGPDGAAAWVGEGVALGHSLLATTPEAVVEKLPLTHEESGCTITADARIDNRDELAAAIGLDLKSRIIGDGELILLSYLKWGEDCPAHLLGDFAFAIWDGHKRRLFCARDQVGMRQLIYCHLPGRLFLFATEPRAILAHPDAPRTINEGRIADYLEGLEAFDLRETFFEGVVRLPPAHVLTVDRKGASSQQYWCPEPQPQLRLGSDQAYAEAFLEVFRAAVRCRLRSAKPVGAMLSGGMDSGSVAAVAAKLLAEHGGGPLQTFSAVGPDPDSCPETRAIMASITMPGIAPKLVSHAELDDYVDDLAELTRMSDEPFDGHMTLIRAVYLAAQRAGVNVMFDGIAGDLTVGAGWTVADRLRRGRFREAFEEARGEAAHWGPQWPVRRTLAHAAWRAWAPRPVRDFRRELVSRLRRSSVLSKSPVSKKFAARVHLTERHRRARELLERLDGLGPRERALAMLHPYLIAGRERYDRVASQFAIEPRDPFLDLRVVHFCLSLPPEQLQSGGWIKRMLRNAMAGLLPDTVRWRRSREHLGWTFTCELFRRHPRLGSGDLPATISPYVNLNMVKGQGFTYRVNAVYLAIWLDMVARQLGIRGGRRQVKGSEMATGKKRAKAYSPPRLVVYGDVARLTATGSTGSPEAGAASSNKIRP